MGWASGMLADGGRTGLQPAPPSTKPITQHRHAYKKNSPYASLNSFADDLALLPIGPRTEQAYWACIRQLAEHYNRSPDLISAEEFRQYCIHLKTDKKVARQTSTQTICAFNKAVP